MNVNDLERFIVEAKARTYVSGGDLGPSSRPASHDLGYERGDWRYLDSYFGGWDFIGQETVWFRGLPVWAMNYYGWISDREAICAEVAGLVIMTALRDLYDQGRFLGGFDTEALGWSYADESRGDVTHFEGRERISRPGKPEVYSLVYHGGLIRSE